MTIAASLVATLGLDSAGFKKGLDKSKSDAKKGSKSIVSSFNTIRSAFAALAAGAGVKQLLAQADAIGKSADAAGFATESYQKLRFGFEQSGISGEKFDASTRKLSTAILGAKDGLATYTRAFDKLGITQQEIETLSPDQLYIRTTEALGKLTNANDRQALATQLLGKSFGDVKFSMDDVIAAGDGINVISDLTAKTAAKTNDAFNRLTTTFTNLATTALVPLVEPLGSVVNMISDFANDHPVITSLAIALAAVAGSIALIGGPITAVVAGITALAYLWENWNNLVITFKEVFPGVSKIFGDVRDGIVSAIDALATPFRWLFGKIADLYKFVTGEELSTNLSDTFGGIADSAGGAVDKITSKLGQFSSKLSELKSIDLGINISGKSSNTGTGSSGSDSSDDSADASSKKAAKTIVSKLSTALEDTPFNRLGMIISEKLSKDEEAQGQIAKSVGSLLNSAFTSILGDNAGVGSALLSGIFSIFGAAKGLPGKALGGPVAAGMPITVGERGRETFIPAVAGEIVPAGQNAMGVNVNITGDISRQTQATIYEMLPDLAAQLNAYNREQRF